MLNPSKSSESGPSQPKRRLHAPLFSLSSYELHKRLVNNYLLSQKGSVAKLQRDTSRDKRDIDVIKENHRFLWNADDTPDSWEQRLAKKYYDKLFKEYSICDLSKYKENKVAMRWRIEQELVDGKGQFQCANKECIESDNLRTWEVNFAYTEHGMKNNALVKLRLCPDCSRKLNYHHAKREIISAKSRRDGGNKKSKRRRTEVTEAEEERDAVAASSEPSPAPDQQEEDEGRAWRASQSTDEKSRDEEFQEYLEELLF